MSLGLAPRRRYPQLMAHPLMVDLDDPFLDRVREIALAFPGAEERISHGRPNFFTTKTFLHWSEGTKWAGSRDYPRALVVLPEAAERPALEQDERFFLPAYLEPYGWVGLDLTRSGVEGREDVDWAEVAELIEQSYRLTAPARLVAQLDREAT